MIGVAYTGVGQPDTFDIRIYDVDSRDCVYSHSSDGLLAGIWTHEKHLRFAIILPGEKVSVWQVAFAPGCRHSKVADDLAAPPGLNPARPFLFNSTLYTISYISRNILKIWDSRNARYPLCTDDICFNGSAMAFSPNGSRFACETIGSDIHLWEDRGGGYAIWWKLTSSVTSPIPLFSSDDNSVIAWNQSMLQLFSLKDSKDSATPTSVDASRTVGQRRPFIVNFSLGEQCIAFARLGGNEVTVVDRRSHDWRMNIDVGMQVQGLKIGHNAITVEGVRQLVTWDLPKERDVSVGSTATVKDSVRTTVLKGLVNWGPKLISISPDLLMLAEIWSERETGTAGSLNIYDVETGAKIGGAKTDHDTPWFSPDGRQVWCGEAVGEVQGWEVVESSGSSKIELTPLAGNRPKAGPGDPPVVTPSRTMD